MGYSPWGCKESDTTEHAHKTTKTLSASHMLALSCPVLFMARHFSHINPFLSTQQLNEVDTIIILILQRRTLRPREVTFVPGHTVNGGA